MQTMERKQSVTLFVADVIALVVSWCENFNI